MGTHGRRVPMEGGYPWVPKGITRKNLRVWVGLGLCLNSMGIFGLGTQKSFLFWVVLGIKPVGKIPALVMTVYGNYDVIAFRYLQCTLLPITPQGIFLSNFSYGNFVVKHPGI